jgi:hypothetical protein
VFSSLKKSTFFIANSLTWLKKATYKKETKLTLLLNTNNLLRDVLLLIYIALIKKPQVAGQCIKKQVYKNKVNYLSQMITNEKNGNVYKWKEWNQSLQM